MIAVCIFIDNEGKVFESQCEHGVRTKVKKHNFIVFVTNDHKHIHKNEIVHKTYIKTQQRKCKDYTAHIFNISVSSMILNNLNFSACCFVR